MFYLPIFLYVKVTLCDPKFDECADILKPFVLGEYPHEGGLPWHEAHRIYSIANINNNHWVVVEINMDEQKMVVYNSISGSIDWKKVPVDFITAAKFILWLLHRMGIWEKRNTSCPLRSVWEIEEYPSPRSNIIVRIAV